MRYKFEYWQSEVDGQWYFHFTSSDEGILFQSAGYEKLTECLRAIDTIKSYGPIAPILQPDVDFDEFIESCYQPLNDEENSSFSSHPPSNYF